SARRARTASPRDLREVAEAAAEEVADVVQQAQAVPPQLRVLGHHEHLVEEAGERVGELLRGRDRLVEARGLAEAGERAVLRLGDALLGVLDEELGPDLRSVVLARLADDVARAR